MGFFNKQDDINEAAEAIAADKVKALHGDLIAENKELRTALRNYKKALVVGGLGGAGYVGNRIYNTLNNKKKKKALSTLLND